MPVFIIILSFILSVPVYGQDLLNLSQKDLLQLQSHFLKENVKENFFTKNSNPVLPTQINNGVLKLGLRERGQIILRATQAQLIITVTKQDLNWQEGSDPLQIKVLDNLNQTISIHEIPDDGTTKANFWRGPLQTQTYDISLPSPGIYYISAQGSRDNVFYITTNASAQSYQSTLELVEPMKPLVLYFEAPSKTFQITLYTPHYAGLDQIIRLVDSNNEIVQEKNIQELNKQYTFQAKSVDKQSGKLWRLEIKRQDLFIQSPQIENWFLSPEDYFDFEATAKLIQPNSLSLFAIPDSKLPLRFTLENTRQSSLTVHLGWTPLTPNAPTITTNSTMITIPSASRTFITPHVEIPADVIPGASFVYQVKLLDESLNFLSIAQAIVEVTKPPPTPTENQPYLYINQENLANVRQKGLEGSQTMQAIYRNLLVWGDSIVRQNLPVPNEEGGWINNYTCDGIGDGDDDPNDAHNVSLIFDPTRSDFYICPIDGERYHGRKYERGWLGLYHFELSRRLKQLGIAYALDPQDRYAELTRQMLLDYTDRYLSWPLDDYQDRPNPQGARIMTDTLSEASWLIPALIAYDFTRQHASYSDGDRARIENNLIRPAAEIIRGNPLGVINIQSWHNTAMLFAGYVLKDSELINEALHGINGHDFLVENAIREDGIWTEGSIGYHFYALIPMNLLLEAIHVREQDPFTAKIGRAYTSVLDLMHHDGTFPDLNDTSAHPIWRRITHYEHANAHYSDNKLDQILHYVYDQLGYNRDSMEALFFGKEYKQLSLDIPGTLKTKMGLSVLRPDNDLSSPMALMDYGPQGLSHGHFDKLHLSLYGKGDVWLPDIGSGSVLIPEFRGWFRQTVGHNTVLLGERNQHEDTEQAREIGDYYNDIPPFQVMRTSFGPPVYPNGSKVERTALLIDRNYMLLLDQIEGGPSPYDIFFHSAGDISSIKTFTDSDIEQAWKNSLSGYQYLQPPRQFNDQHPASILHYADNNNVHIQTKKSYGFTDRLENINDWSGNIGLSTDTVQGRHALNWVIVPREYQSVEKRFHHLGNFSLPDRLVFDYKIEATTFSRFLVRINSTNTLHAQWEITTSDEFQPNVWQTAEIDLTEPDQTYTNTYGFNRLQFSLTGTENNTETFNVRIDNIRSYKNGEILLPEKRGLNFLFPGGEHTHYYLASGPSTNPPRTHPVIIARREELDSTLHITLLEPFLNKPSITSIQSTTDQVTFDTENDHCQVSWNRSNHSYDFTKTSLDHRYNSLAVINDNSLSMEHIAYEAIQSTIFSIETTHYDERTWKLSYIKPRTHEDQLILTSTLPPEDITLDASSIFSWEIQPLEDHFRITLQNLDSGSHQITIHFGGSTRISDWLLQQ